MDGMTSNLNPIALVTGGSAGLGLVLVEALGAHGWTVLTDGRDPVRLLDAVGGLAGVTAIPGDVSDATHRAALVEAVRRHGRLDVLVHNASTLGPLPLRNLADLELEQLRLMWATNVGGPYELNRALLPELRAADGMIISISSDAAVQHYPTWGGYAASKATLDHLTLTFAAETGVTAYAVDPGDMRTRMHADAFPGEDISDRPLPGTVVPHLLGLLEQRPASGRYLAAEIIPLTAGASA